MAETLAQLAAALNKAKGAWIALVAIGTLAASGMFALTVFIASENVDRIKQIREGLTDHEKRISRIEGHLKLPEKEK